jgi:hypothetical protein
MVLRLVAKPHPRYPNMVPCYYYVVDCDHIPNLTAIGICPTWSEVRAIQLFDERCLAEQIRQEWPA